MTKEKKVKAKETKTKKLSFKEELLASKLTKRISPTTLEALANNLDKESALKEILMLLNPFFRICSIEEFIEISTAIKELNGR